MPIHFSCIKCHKSLFAQDKYAGRVALCPACLTQNIIPPPAGETVTSSDALVVDMEAAPAETPPPAAYVAAVGATAGGLPASTVATPHATPAVTPQSAVESAVAAPAPSEINPAPPTAASIVAPGAADAEPTKKCPLCAETIKAAARKCRYCHAILDEDLRAEEDQARREQLMSGVLAVAERSAKFWRAMSVIVTGCTVGWLTLLTLNLFPLGMEALPLIVFNILLIVGLFWSTRQMRDGPHNVFMAAACAVLLCMPLNIAMGMPLISVDPEQLKQLQKQNPQMTEKLLQAGAGLFCSIVGLFFSIPIWIATLKVAGVQRLRQMAAAQTASGGTRR